MKLIKDASPEEVEQILSLSKLQAATTGEIREIQGYIQTFIDPSCNICTNCPSQVRFAYNRFKMWVERNKTELQSQLNVNEYKKSVEPTSETIDEIKKEKEEAASMLEKKEKRKKLLKKQPPIVNENKRGRGRPKGSTNK